MTREPVNRPLAYSPEVPGDIRDLPHDRLRRIALYRIDALTAGELYGKELRSTKWPPLAGVYSLDFDTRHELKRFRIVYRSIPGDAPDHPSTLHVIAVGPRQDLEVYLRAAERLGTVPRRAVVNRVAELTRQADRCRMKAKRLEGQADSLSAKIERGDGAAYRAARKAGATPAQLRRAQEQDLGAVHKLRSTAAELRTKATKLRAERQQLDRHRLTPSVVASLQAYAPAVNSPGDRPRSRRSGR